jgi:hypothetical protein
MKTVLYNKRERVVIDYIPFSEKEFIDILLKQTPKEIFHEFYSKEKPCWVITNYVDEKTIEYFATSWANKTPITIELTNFYRYISNQGLQQCSFKNET